MIQILTIGQLKWEIKKFRHVKQKKRNALIVATTEHNLVIQMSMTTVSKNVWNNALSKSTQKVVLTNAIGQT